MASQLVIQCEPWYLVHHRFHNFWQILSFWILGPKCYDVSYSKLEHQANKKHVFWKSPSGTWKYGIWCIIVFRLFGTFFAFLTKVWWPVGHDFYYSKLERRVKKEKKRVFWKSARKTWKCGLTVSYLMWT